jgi:protein Mpv17
MVLGARAMAALTHLRQGAARAWSSYEGALERRPLATQATTSALLWGAGDLLAQRIERSEARADRRRAAAAAAAAASAAGGRKRAGGAGAGERPPSSSSPPAHGNDDNVDAPYDFGRAALTAMFGGVMVGPVGHVWYSNLDRIILATRRGLLAAGAGGGGGRAAAVASSLPAAAAAATTSAAALVSTPAFIAAKVLLDTAVMGPFYVASYFTFGATVMDGGGWREAKQKLESDFWPTLAAEVCFWPAVQGVNFWRVPARHQLLVVNALTVADAAFMSWARAQDDWLAAVRERWGPAGGGGGGAGLAAVGVFGGEGHGGGWRVLPAELAPPPRSHRRAPKGGAQQQQQQQQRQAAGAA